MEPKSHSVHSTVWGEISEDRCLLRQLTEYPVPLLHGPLPCRNPRP